MINSSSENYNISKITTFAQEFQWQFVLQNLEVKTFHYDANEFSF